MLCFRAQVYNNIRFLIDFGFSTGEDVVFPIETFKRLIVLHPTSFEFAW